MNKNNKLLLILTGIILMAGVGFVSYTKIKSNIANEVNRQVSLERQNRPQNPRGQGIGGIALTKEQKEACGITVSTTEGPYYITNTLKLSDNKSLNYTNMAGTKLNVSGYVYSGETGNIGIPNSKIEIWQVGSDRKYHPQANGDYSKFKPEEFQLRGYILTDGEGKYSFDTVSPALYEGRARHIHLRISAENHNAVTTQLIMPENGDNPSVENDNVAQGLPNCQILTLDKSNNELYQAKFNFRLKEG